MSDQVADELAERGLLCGRAGVLGRLAVGCASADVRDADGTRVLTGDVCSDFFQRSPDGNATIEVNDEMVADVRPPELFVPPPNSVDVYSLPSGVAVQWTAMVCSGRMISLPKCSR